MGNNKLYPQTQVPTQKDLYLFENGKYVGSVNVKDELKNDAKTTIQYF
ncbi:MAG: hypothetical protein H6554_02175 [Chitinophagales bacterium]|nr:hypothetical protein [Chitinophagales bacterium]